MGGLRSLAGQGSGESEEQRDEQGARCVECEVTGHAHESDRVGSETRIGTVTRVARAMVASMPRGTEGT